ncbi:MAG: hypothetical protein A07HR67_00941 [uncultured archaeon A07HR67]|nr:MAG: hypothetical protein A07HR67_00941 [uncultured archaeon A07HR67]
MTGTETAYARWLIGCIARRETRHEPAAATRSPTDQFGAGTPGAASIEPGDEVRAVADSVGPVGATVTR